MEKLRQAVKKKKKKWAPFALGNLSRYKLPAIYVELKGRDSP